MNPPGARERTELVPHAGLAPGMPGITIMARPNCAIILLIVLPNHTKTGVPLTAPHAQAAMPAL
jgi:hypothetical protein